MKGMTVIVANFIIIHQYFLALTFKDFFDSNITINKEFTRERIPEIQSKKRL